MYEHYILLFYSVNSISLTLWIMFPSLERGAKITYSQVVKPIQQQVVNLNSLLVVLELTSGRMIWGR